jgi:hypothetical protein
METVIPSVLPLKLKALQAPNALMAILVSSIPNAMNFMINPVVSTWSDRFRSPWGRRMPFLFVATPPLTFFLIAMGFCDPIGRFLHAPLSHLFVSLSPTKTIILVIGVLMVCFQFFNMFVASVYYYLFNDVVPKAYLARCMALFRVVGSAAGSLYSFFIYQYAATHMREIFLGAAVLYCAAFTLMCLKVKEGKYPPPPPSVGNRKGLLAMIRTYAVECFSHRFYWYFFLSGTFWSLAGCISMFNVFLWLGLGMNLNQLGKVGGIAGIVSTILLYPAGMLADRIHPLRVMIGAKILITLLAPIPLIYLIWDFSPHTVFLIYIATTCVSLPIGVMYSASSLPMYMSVLPQERYGQFCSADAMVGAVARIGGAFAAGKFIDIVMRTYAGGGPEMPDPTRYAWMYPGLQGSNLGLVPVFQSLDRLLGSYYCYRFNAFWTIFFEGLSLVFLFLLYRGWKRYGGMKNYVPPATGAAIEAAEDAGNQGTSPRRSP